MSSKKIIVLMGSFALAYIIGEGLFPTPNVVGGGEGKMFLLIFLSVGFRVVIEFSLSRLKRKKEAKHVDKPLV